MSRPVNKRELEILAAANFKKLMDLIDSIPSNQKDFEFPKGMLNRNITDVLCHLHAWHQLFFDWYKIGMKGEKPAMPAEGYGWKDTSLLNQKIREDYKAIPMNLAQQKIQASHSEIMKLVAGHQDAELFEKKRYPWTGSTSLGAYIISASSSHYDWAYKLIRKAAKNQGLL